VPFWEALAEAIPPASVRLRRDIGQVIRCVKAHALLHIVGTENVTIRVASLRT